MQLHSLTLMNVGVYRGSNTVRFSSLPAKPITLIGGKNGTGKTSLLDSIPLVLYGNRARRVLNGVSYPEYLQGLVHHGERSAAICLEFERTEGGQPVQYRVERSWNRTSRGRATDVLAISTNGEPRSDLVAAWPEFVEGIMPIAVAALAIFDGEKIESLADPLSSAEVLRTSLYGLLGLDLIDRLRSDLQNYRRRAAKAHDSRLATELGKFLAEAEQLLADAQEQRDAGAQAVDAAQATKARLEADLERATDKLARAGGNLHAEREDLHRRLAESTVSGTAVEREVLQLAAGDLPLALVRDLLKLLVAVGNQRDQAVIAAGLNDAMRIRDERLINQISTSFALRPSKVAELRGLMRSDLEGVEQPAIPSFAPTQDAAESARSLLHHRSADLIDEAKRLTTALAEYDEESERLERMLASAPDAESIATTVQEVATAEAELRVAESAYESAIFSYSVSERCVDQARRDVDSLAHRILDAGAADANSARITREVSAADKVLTDFADRMIRKHLGRITDEINYSLQKLLRKNGLIKGVRIDPSDLAVTLIDREDRILDAKRLSAGERQIMATAVLWGLSRSTGMTLPTVIDTPVGRLDRSHRTNLVERYFPNAARQVVLLSTDEEIVGEHRKRLTPYVGAEYRLEFDEVEACTSIVEGYLDE